MCNDMLYGDGHSCVGKINDANALPMCFNCLCPYAEGIGPIIASGVNTRKIGKVTQTMNPLQMIV